MESSLSRGKESLCIAARDWFSSFLRKRCTDWVFGHTFRSLCQTLKWVGTLWERDERALGVAYLSYILVGSFIVLKKGGGSTVVLSWHIDLMLQWWSIVNNKAIIAIARRLVIVSGSTSWCSLPSFKPIGGMSDGRKGPLM